MEKQVFKGRLLKVYRRSVKLPNGYTASLEVIKHPGAALVVPFLNNDTVIILKQLRSVVGEYLYEFPAGTLDPGETPLACCRREIVEETGYAATKFTKLGSIYPVPGYSTERIVIFKACALRKVEKLTQQDEIIRVEIRTRQEIVKLFKAGKIIDAKTICALAMTGWVC